MTAVAVDSTSAIRDLVASANTSGDALRIAGRGTWLDARQAVRAKGVLSTHELSGVTEYVPGDLTLSARAGTTLAEIRDATEKNGQWLVLDPFGGDEGTIGATIATASVGPLRTGFGSPRDLVLGLEFVTGAGVIARSGGRVVKNVAGFDISKLMTGSWGTLAVITEVTVRLHAKPGADVTIGIPLDGPARVAEVRQLLRGLPFTPYACEILNDDLAKSVGAGDGTIALFRLGGNAASVQAQRAAIAKLGNATELGHDVWDRLRQVESKMKSPIVFRLSRPPAEIGEMWNDAMRIASACSGTMVHASPARGIVRCVVPSSTNAEQSLTQWFAGTKGGTRIGERLPASLWQACAPPPTNDRLSQRVKLAFDPRRVLNPGILGESA